MYKLYFDERTDYYARRARQPKRGAASPEAAGALEDNVQLVRNILPRAADGEREDIRQEQPEAGSAPGLAIQDEIEANESGERTDPDS